MAHVDVIVRATVLRRYDDAFPGWLEVSVRDHAGREHLIRDKTPVLSSAPVSPDASFPFELWLRAEAQTTTPNQVEVRLSNGLATVDGSCDLVVTASDVVWL